MNVYANERNLTKLGRYWTGSPFKENDDLQAFADQLGIINFVARLAIAEHEFLGDIEVEIEVSNEEIDKRIDDMFAAARAVCKMKR